MASGRVGRDEAPRALVRVRVRVRVRVSRARGGDAAADTKLLCVRPTDRRASQVPACDRRGLQALRLGRCTLILWSWVGICVSQPSSRG